MIPEEIIKHHYNEGGELYHILETHCHSVANKALSILKMHPEMQLDAAFVYEAAMLHDIGIFLTNAPKISCFGEYSYICHGYLGRELLEREGFFRHALVCERHTGTGLELHEIIEKNLPLPSRDMMPLSLEEKLICFADKFYSKTKLEKEKPIDKIRKGLAKYGENSVSRFDEWCKLFLG